MESVTSKRVFERPLVERPDRPEGEGGRAGSVLEIQVIFTRMPASLRAMERAAELARGLQARVRLVVPQVVHYAVPLDTPPVMVEFSESRFRRLTQDVTVETHVEIYLCRDASEAVVQCLAPRSLVVIGGKRTWWLTAEKTLARRLRRLGHEVVFVECANEKECRHA